MGIFGFVKNEVRQMAIARPDNVKHLIVYKHPDETIPKWAQLTVDSDEGAVFFKDGRVHGILGAGRHTLDAAMYPFLTGLVDKFGGGDVFKSEVFFVRTQPLRNDPVKFGAQVSMTDPVTQRPCTPMIHGEIVVRVMDPVKFIIGLTGQGHQALDNDVICEYISKKFRSGVRQALATILKEAQTSILEYDMERDRINDGFKARSAVPDFEEIGVVITEIVDFMVKLKPEDRQKIEASWEKMKVAVLEKRAELEMRKMDIEVDVAERQAYVNMANNPAYMAHAQAEALMGAGQGMAKGGGDGTGVAQLGAQMAVGMGMAGMFHQGMQPAGVMAPQYQRVQPAPGGSVNCGSCGAPNPGGKFCSNCGSPLAPPQPQGGFCSNCGGQLAPGAKFCAGCGAPAPGGQGGPPPQAGPQGGGYPPAQGQPGQPQAQGYPQAQPGRPQAQPQGYPQAQPGYPQAPPQGYPQAPQPGYPQAPQPGYPQAPQGQPPGGGQYAGGYPPPGGGQGGHGQGGHGQGG